MKKLLIPVLLANLATYAFAADPQYSAHDRYPYPKVAGVEAVADGQTVTLGEVTVTAHRTPGHTPGGTSWSWRSCEDGKCLDLV